MCGQTCWVLSIDHQGSVAVTVQRARLIMMINRIIMWHSHGNIAPYLPLGEIIIYHWLLYTCLAFWKICVFTFLFIAETIPRWHPSSLRWWRLTGSVWKPALWVLAPRLFLMRTRCLIIFNICLLLIYVFDIVVFHTSVTWKIKYFTGFLCYILLIAVFAKS